MTYLNQYLSDENVGKSKNKLVNNKAILSKNGFVAWAGLPNPNNPQEKPKSGFGFYYRQQCNHCGTFTDHIAKYFTDDLKSWDLEQEIKSRFPDGGDVARFLKNNTSTRECRKCLMNDHRENIKRFNDDLSFKQQSLNPKKKSRYND